MSWSRRQLVAGLSGLAGVACVRGAPLPPPPSVAPETPIHLGWRWVPGAQETWRTTLTREQDRITLRTACDWTYTALRLERGTAILHGRLTGFGGAIAVDGQPLEGRELDIRLADARAAQPEEVELQLTLQGGIVRCSVDDFSSALPHRLLGLRLPAEAVAPGATWTDDSLVRTFAALFPPDLPTQGGGSTRVQGRGDAGDEGLEVDLLHTATLHVRTGGPNLRLSDRIVWHTQPGMIASRFLSASLADPRSSPGDLGNPGFLTAEVRHLPPRGATSRSHR